MISSPAYIGKFMDLLSIPCVIKDKFAIILEFSPLLSFRGFEEQNY
jgi:hypothetical protein